jgi:hypothetical protein
MPCSRWFLGSLQFITDKFEDLTLQEHESRRIIGSGTSHLPLAPVQFGLINEVQLGHGLNELGKTGTNPAGNKADHTPAVPVATTGPIY